MYIINLLVDRTASHWLKQTHGSSAPRQRPATGTALGRWPIVSAVDARLGTIDGIGAMQSKHLGIRADLSTVPDRYSVLRTQSRYGAGPHRRPGKGAKFNKVSKHQST